VGQAVFRSVSYLSKRTEPELITKAECNLCRDALIIRLTAATELSEAKMLALKNQIEGLKGTVKVVGLTMTTTITVAVTIITFLLNHFHM